LSIETLPAHAASIEIAKQCFDCNLEENLNIVKNNFICIILVIKQLEKSGISLCDALHTLSEVRKNIKQPHIPEKIRYKTVTIIIKNSGLQNLMKILECDNQILLMCH